MRINVWKFSLVYISVLVVSCSCFQNHIQSLTDKVNELFGKKPFKDDSYGTVTTEGKLDNGETIGPKFNNTNDKLNFFGLTWRTISSKIVNNWWIIAFSTLLPFIIFWRIQYNMKKRLYEWKKLFIQKEKSYTHTRRPTLPDLTLAKHARRESLAEATQKLTNRPRKLSQYNISLFKSIKRNSIDRNEESTGEIKRVHLIRRRH